MKDVKQTKLDPMYYGCDPRDIAQDFYEWGIVSLEDITERIEADEGGISPEDIYKRVTRLIRTDRRKEKEREPYEIREKMKTACLRVLNDPTASSAETIKALEIMDDLRKGR